MSIIEIIESRIARALRGLRFPYRARLTARDDAPGLQLAQADALAGEQAQAVEVLQQFGFSSGVPEGSDLIVIPLGGRTSASVIIATENAAYRLKVGPGEARMYSQDGASIRRCAIENGVTIFTSLDTARIVTEVLEEMTISVSTINAE